MIDRRQEERRKGERRESDQAPKYKELRLGTLLIAIVIIVAVIIGSIIAIKSYRHKKAIESIEKRHSGVYSCTFSIDGPKNSLSAGETAVFEFKASNINAEDGITMLEGLLDYDYKIFDCNIEDIENGKWYKLSMLEDYLTMVRSDYMPSSEDQVIGRLVVKLRDQVKPGNYQITFKNAIFTMDDNKDFSVEDVNIPITVK